jgi:hypothetical protein
MLKLNHGIVPGYKTIRGGNDGIESCRFIEIDDLADRDTGSLPLSFFNEAST